MQTPDIDGLGETREPDSFKDTVPYRACIRRSGAERRKPDTANHW